MATSLEYKVQKLLDHNAAIDALHRFVYGLDLADASLVSSAFILDATVDLTPFNKLGFSFKVLSGKDLIVETLMAGVGSIDSSHHLSNFRVKISENDAYLTCYSLAQHFRPGEGPGLQFQDYLLLGNRYTADLVRDGEEFKIKKIVIDCAWSVGTKDVISHH